MRLSEIRHQDRAVSILRRALESGRTHHAYLFDGPDGVGKESAARALAARLLCTGGDSPAADQGSLFADLAEPESSLDACGCCPSCTLLERNSHPDFHPIHRGMHRQHPDSTIRAGKGLYLVVQLIRHFLIEPASLSPTVGLRRVFLIREAERMNEAAQNALLKTLEEPPGTAVLILVSSSAQRLLPTIRSRCQRVPFGLLPPAYVAERLGELTELDAAAARTLAGLSGGRLGAALHWHRLGMLDTLESVAGLVVARSPHDPVGFGKGMIEAADGLGTRLMKLDAERAEESSAGGGARGRSTGKGLPTDVLRDALKLGFMLVGALYRDALLAHEAAAPELRQVHTCATQVDQLRAATTSSVCEAAIQGVAEAEQMLDRNVAPPLVCERLAGGLGELRMQNAERRMQK